MKSKLKVRAIYTKKKKFSKLKVEYDKTSKVRPAWIYIKNLPEGTGYITIKLKDRLWRYRIYLPPYLFLPIDYTKEEMKKYYNRFSKFYDKDVKKHGQNIKAIKFLINKLLKYIPNKKIRILDIGSGTGLVSEYLIKKGFANLTLLDYSPKMLKKAKAKTLLKKCEFILGDLRRIKIKKKFDLIISVFSIGSISYFDEKEINLLYKKVSKLLDKKGFIAILGHDTPPKYFKIIKQGKYNLFNNCYVNYYIGRKKSKIKKLRL